jgi:long-chain acyl-CoA synthetase
MKRTFIAASLSLLLASAAFAAEVGGVKLDDKISLGGKELVLNGAGVRIAKVVFKVYVASLYLPAKAGDLGGVLAGNPRRVQLNLLRDLSADDLAEALADGIKETSSAEQAAAVKTQTGQLLSIMKSVGQAKTGDVVTMDFVNGETRIAFNGQAKGSIPGEPFNAALMRIWLADKPVQTDLRKAMLGV